MSWYLKHKQVFHLVCELENFYLIRRAWTGIPRKTKHFFICCSNANVIVLYTTPAVVELKLDLDIHGLPVNVHSKPPTDCSCTDVCALTTLVATVAERDVSRKWSRGINLSSDEYWMLGRQEQDQYICWTTLHPIDSVTVLKPMPKARSLKLCILFLIQVDLITKIDNFIVINSQKMITIITLTRTINFLKHLVSIHFKCNIISTFYWGACTKSGNWVVMYFCVREID